MKLLIWRLKVFGSNFATSNQSKTHIKMNKLLSLVIIMIMAAFQAMAQESKTNTSSQCIKLEITQFRTHKTGVHRAPMYISIEAFYDAENNSIDISYNGEANGEVFLYKNESIIEYDSNLNTSLHIPSSPGLYRIDIISEYWSAQGYIQL